MRAVGSEIEEAGEETEMDSTSEVESISSPLLRRKHHMKITANKTVPAVTEMRNWVFVKVQTDQPGLYGWGEASLEWKN